MQTRIFHIDRYLGPQQAYHFAHKRLDAQPPAYRHGHDYYELFLIEKGTALHHINGQSERLAPGALCFVRPQDRHALEACDDDGCVIFNVVIHPDTVHHLQSRYGDDLGARYFWLADAMPDLYRLTGPRLERAINATVELQHARRSLARVEHYLLNLMTRVVDFDHMAPEGAPAWLASACQAARRPEVFRQGATGFVEAAGRGHAHVCRVTQEHLGRSPSVLINQIRMEHAAMLLGSTNQPIAEIARTCGIENVSHFYKLFRSIYGNTPAQYRRFHRRDPMQAR